MSAMVEKQGNVWRVTEETGVVVKGRGTPIDGGGFPDRKQADLLANAYNTGTAGSDMDEIAANAKAADRLLTLSELFGSSAAVKKSIKEYRDAATEAQKANEDLAAKQGNLSHKEKSLSEREQKLAEEKSRHENAVADFERASSERSANLDTREVGVMNREEAAKATEKEAKKLHQQAKSLDTQARKKMAEAEKAMSEAQELKSRYEAKLSRVRELAAEA